MLGTPLARGSGAAPMVPALHPQGRTQASAAPRDARAASNRSRSWKPSLGRAQQRSILLLDSATRSNSLFERNTNRYPEKPFSLQIAGCRRLWRGEEGPILRARGWMLLGAAGSLPGTSGCSLHLFQQNLGCQEG